METPDNFENPDFNLLFGRIKHSPRKDITDRDSRSVNDLQSEWNSKRHILLQERYSKDTLARFLLACSTQLIIAGWLACVIIILIGKAHLSLSNSVLITLLATTTTTVIGLALIVLKGFFQHMNQNVELKD